MLSVAFAVGAVICFFAMTGEPIERVSFSQELLIILKFFACSLVSAIVSFGLYAFSALCADIVEKQIQLVSKAKVAKIVSARLRQAEAKTPPKK